MSKVKRTRSITYRVKLSDREVRAIRELLRPSLDCRRAYSAIRQAQKFYALEQHETNSIRKAYYKHLYELKMRKVEFYKERIERSKSGIINIENNHG